MSFISSCDQLHKISYKQIKFILKEYKIKVHAFSWIAFYGGNGEATNDCNQ